MIETGRDGILVNRPDGVNRRIVRRDSPVCSVVRVRGASEVFDTFSSPIERGHGVRVIFLDNKKKGARNGVDVIFQEGEL